MIIKTTIRGNGPQLAQYLEARGENEEVKTGAVHRLATYLLAQGKNEEVKAGAVRGATASTINAALQEMEARGMGCRSRDTLGHVIASPDRVMTADEWKTTWDIYERAHGIEGRPFVEVWHSKPGETDRPPHCHRVYSWVDDTGRKTSTFRSKIKDELASRQCEHTLGDRYTPMVERQAGQRTIDHTATVARFAHDRGLNDLADWIQQQATTHKVKGQATNRAEMAQQQRTKVRATDVRGAVLSAWRAGDSGTAFRAALESTGLKLARGDRSDFVVVDQAGGVHDLGRSLAAAAKAEGVTLGARGARGAIRARLGDIDPQALASIAEVRQERQASEAARWQAGNAHAVTSETRRPPRARAEGADALQTLLEQRAVFTDSELRRACLKAAGGDQAKGDALYQAQRAGLITLQAGANPRYTTSHSFTAEQRIVRLTEAAAASRRFAMAENDAQRAIDRWHEKLHAELKAAGKAIWSLKGEQVAAVRDMLSGADMVSIQGRAGTGKSTMLDCAQYGLDAAGHRVEGVALSGKAATGLAEIGIKGARTIHSWVARFDRQAAYATAQTTGNLDADYGDTTVRADLLASLDRWQAKEAGKKSPSQQVLERIAAHRAEIEGKAALSAQAERWVDQQIARQLAGRTDSRTVLFVDEAGMAGHRLTADLLSRARSVGAKVVMVGDEQQLQPIEAGAAYRVINEVLAEYQQGKILTEVNRQVEEWQRRATVDLSTGKSEDAETAIRAYADHGCVTAGIRGADLSPATLAEEAEAALGRALPADERRHQQRVAEYYAARLEAGVLWSEIQGSGSPERHPLYDQFSAAKAARDDGARAIAAHLEAAKPWLARYGVDGEGLAADILAASGTKRQEAQDKADATATQLGVTAADLAPLADCHLTLDLRAGARDALMSSWERSITDHPSASHLILASTNRDVDRLNDAARPAWRAAGRLSGDELTFETADKRPLTVAIGDRLVAGRNDAQLKNGAFGTVTAITSGSDDASPSLTLKLDGGGEVEIDLLKYTHLDYGYASTVHKSQGATVDNCCVLFSGLMDRHTLYVALSRHRDTVSVVASSADAPTVDSIIAAAGRARAAEAIRDYLAEADQSAPASPASVKAFLTRDDRQQLHDLGLRRAEVAEIGPEEAQAILEATSPETRANALAAFRRRITPQSVHQEGASHEPTPARPGPTGKPLSCNQRIARDDCPPEARNCLRQLRELPVDRHDEKLAGLLQDHLQRDLVNTGAGRHRFVQPPDLSRDRTDCTPTLTPTLNGEDAMPAALDPALVAEASEAIQTFEKADQVFHDTNSDIYARWRAASDIDQSARAFMWADPRAAVAKAEGVYDKIMQTHDEASKFLSETPFSLIDEYLYGQSSEDRSDGYYNDEVDIDLADDFDYPSVTPTETLAAQDHDRGLLAEKPSDWASELAKAPEPLMAAATAWNYIGRAHQSVIADIKTEAAQINVALTDGATLRDTGAKIDQPHGNLTRTAADVMALAAAARGWKSVNLTGTLDEKKALTALVVDGQASAAAMT
ncbi:MAG: AAA family ATPase [Alphaproteobacteria bacterium]|nr:AAA family ATPase [Alphaproteobacteria bacterium]